MSSLDVKYIKTMVKKALDEDIGSGDITTDSIIPSDITADGIIASKGKGVIAGLPIVKTIFDLLNPNIKLNCEVKEGANIEKGTNLCKISGPARAILTGERVALNFLTYLSGIATYTNMFVEKAKPFGVSILDTRKTIPGLRYIEKYAVRIGGGVNHRLGLFDLPFIKDNHLKILSKVDPEHIATAIRRAQGNNNRKVEIEVTSEEEADLAYSSGADILLLDNMDIGQLSHIVKKYKGKVVLEVSGGVNLDNVENIARTGVDYISVGSITHSAPALDIHLDIL